MPNRKLCFIEKSNALQKENNVLVFYKVLFFLFFAFVL